MSKNTNIGISVYGTFTGDKNFLSYNIDTEFQKNFKGTRYKVNYNQVDQTFFEINFFDNKIVYTIYTTARDHVKRIGFYAVSIVTSRNEIIDDNVFLILSKLAKLFKDNNVFQNNIISGNVKDSLYIDEINKISLSEKTIKTKNRKVVLYTDNVENVFENINKSSELDFSEIIIIPKQFDIRAGKDYEKYNGFSEFIKNDINVEDPTKDEIPNNDTPVHTFNVIFKVKNQNGNIIADEKIDITINDEKEINKITNSDGEFNIKVSEGEIIQYISSNEQKKLKINADSEVNIIVNTEKKETDANTDLPTDTNKEGNKQQQEENIKRKKRIKFVSAALIVPIIILIFFLLFSNDNEKNTVLFYDFYKEAFKRLEQQFESNDLIKVYNANKELQKFKIYQIKNEKKSLNLDKMNGLITIYNDSAESEIKLNKIDTVLFIQSFAKDNYSDIINELEKAYIKKTDEFIKRAYRCTRDTLFDTTINNKYIDTLEQCKLQNNKLTIKIRNSNSERSVVVYDKLKDYNKISETVNEARYYMEFNETLKDAQKTDIALLRVEFKNIRGSGYDDNLGVKGDANPYQLTDNQLKYLYGKGADLYFKDTNIKLYPYEDKFDYEYNHGQNIKIEK